MNNIPTATQWTLTATDNVHHTVINSVFMIICHKTSSKGTGFLLANGYIITNEHVVRNCDSSEIFATSSFNERIEFSQITIDRQRDLVILKPRKPIESGLNLDHSENLTIGQKVITWGYPLTYNGPSPLLSVGYLAGFVENIETGKPRKHLIINGAFNPGNSGGPLINVKDNRVIGVVVNKCAPFTNFQNSALMALANNKNGLIFHATNDVGEQISFSESQLVADILKQFRNLTQVMIGEAICASELNIFLKEQGLPL